MVEFLVEIFGVPSRGLILTLFAILILIKFLRIIMIPKPLEMPNRTGQVGQEYVLITEMVLVFITMMTVFMRIGVGDG